MNSSKLTCFSWIDDAHLFIGDEAGFLSVLDLKERRIDTKINIGVELYPMERLIQAGTRYIEDCYTGSNHRDRKEDLVENEEKAEVLVGIQVKTNEKLPIRQIIRLSNGFICLVGPNRLVVYFLNGLDEYKIRHVVQLPHERNSSSNFIGKFKHC